MLERIVIAGSGGQGIVLAGKLLATAATRSVPHVTFFPSYGAEVRGGVSSCQVVMSSDEIASPLPDDHDSYIVMNQASADHFLSRIRKNKLVLINSSICHVKPSFNAVLIRASEMAEGLGNICVATFIMLGAYLARKPVVDPGDVEMDIEQVLAGKPREIVDLNVRALRTGLAT